MNATAVRGGTWGQFWECDMTDTSGRLHYMNKLQAAAGNVVLRPPHTDCPHYSLHTTERGVKATAHRLSSLYPSYYGT
jgi:hypothetical protein